VMAYVMTDLCKEPAAPSRHYYDGILEGYRQNGLPTDSLKRALEHSVKEVHARMQQVNSLFRQRSKPPKGRSGHER